MTCDDLEVLIAARASGDVTPGLTPEEASRLERHLAGCERCRAELAACEEVVGLARLPAEPEPDLAVASLARWRERRRRRFGGIALGAGLAAAAAAALLALAPGLLDRHQPAPPPATASQQPDADAAYDLAAYAAADVGEDASDDATTPEELAVAALADLADL